MIFLKITISYSSCLMLFNVQYFLYCLVTVCICFLSSFFFWMKNKTKQTTSDSNKRHITLLTWTRCIWICKLITELIVNCNLLQGVRWKIQSASLHNLCVCRWILNSQNDYWNLLVVSYIPILLLILTAKCFINWR